MPRASWLQGEPDPRPILKNEPDMNAVKNFREKALSGMVWSVASQIGRQGILLISNIILARLLTPHDFGLVATVLIFVNFAMIVADQGFGAALIQRPELTEEHLSSIYWINVAMGMFLTAIFLWGAPLIAGFFHEDALAPLMRGIAWIFVVNSLASVQKTLLTRRLAFKTIAKAEVIAAWVGGVTSIILAWRGWGAWSIIVQSAVAAVIGVVVLWRVSEWRPRAVFRWAAVRGLAGFSANHFLGNISNYWVRNVDNVLIGYVLGQGPLGIYTRAYSVMLFPLSRISRVLSRVMFPSLSLIQADHARVRGLFLKVTRVIALVTFPIMLGVAASAENFTAVVFGEQWGGMVPILRILAVVGMVQSVTSLIGNVYLSQNRASLRLRVVLPIQALQVLGIVIGLRWGILGVAIGYAVASLATAPIECHFAGGLIGMSVSDFASNLRGVFLCAAAMALVVAGLGAIFPAAVGVFARFGLQVLVGGAVYLGSLHAFSIKGYGELLDVLRGLIRRQKPAPKAIGEAI